MSILVVLRGENRTSVMTQGSFLALRFPSHSMGCSARTKSNHDLELYSKRGNYEILRKLWLTVILGNA